MSTFLILDEPSAVLSGKEVAILFTQLRKLKARGVTIIYISHRLEELMVIADVITVIKDGETVKTLDPQSCSEDEIITSMVGRKLESLYPEKNVPGNEVVLEVKALSTRALLHGINLTLHKGEIVGLAGLVGAGRSEVARCLFGIDKIAGERCPRPVRLFRLITRHRRCPMGLVWCLKAVRSRGDFGTPNPRKYDVIESEGG